jgi:type IV fimbrial biogenesis protein FimT
MKFGFSLLELMVTVALLGIVCLFAIPQFEQRAAAENLKSAVSDAEAMIQHAKSQAITRHQHLWLHVVPSDSSPSVRFWQIYLSETEQVDKAGRTLFSISGERYPQVMMKSGVAGDRLSVDGEYGKLGNGHLRFYLQNAPERAIKVIMSYGAGRIRCCSIEKATYGYPIC